MAWRHLIPLPSTLQRGLRQSGLDVPSAIQRAAAPRIFAGESVALHAETGSGKTLAFLAPLLARCKLGVPRQVLVLVPSHQLALQTLDVADALREAGGDYGGALPLTELLRPAKPADRSQSLASQHAEILIATGAQLAALLPTLESDSVAESLLRSNLKTVVIDEVDAQLKLLTAVAGRPSMHRRVARDRYLGRSALGQALRLVLARGRRGGRARPGTGGSGGGDGREGGWNAEGAHRRSVGAAAGSSGSRFGGGPGTPGGRSSFGRVQLVALTATLSHTALRDLLGVVGHEPGRMGLVVAASGGASAGHGALAEAAARARRSKPLPPIGPVPPMPHGDGHAGGARSGVGGVGEGLGHSTEEAWREYSHERGDGDEEKYEEEGLGLEEEAAVESAASNAHAGELSALRSPDRLATARPPQMRENLAPSLSRRGEPPTPREGYGVRGGVLRVPVPSSISHSVLLCRERHKAAAAAAVLGDASRGSSLTSLLVMKDEIEMEDALQELRRAGVVGARSLDEVAAAAAAALGLPAQGDGEADVVSEGAKSEGTRGAGARGEGVRGEAVPSPNGFTARPFTARPAADGARLAIRGREALDRLDTAAESPPADTLQLPEWAMLRRRGNRAGEHTSGGAGGVGAKQVVGRKLSGKPIQLGSPSREEGIGLSGASEGSDGAGGGRVEAGGSGRGSGALARAITATGARVIVAHESAVRGLDLPSLDLVVLMMLPDTPEAYMHIAGRTGRFGRKGHVVSIWTRREHDRSGFVTASLRGVKFKTSEFESNVEEEDEEEEA